MARTPLLSRFQELFADFDEAERSGRTVESVQEERRQMRLTRRDFLKVGGAAVGAAALSGPITALAAPHRTGGTQGRIAIIGGGISGLNAALTLQDAGIASTVYEASGRVGGRMHSDTTSWLNGQTSEHCGELIDTGHTTILSLATRFNLPVVNLHNAEPPNSTETYFFGGSYYTRAQANKDFEPVFDRLTADNNAAPFPTLYNSFNEAGSDLDHMSVYQWIESRVPGGHSSKMGQLLDVAYNIEYGNVTTQQSSLNLVYLLFNTRRFVVFGASDETFHIAGGNERLPKAIRAALPPSSVKLNTRLTGIVHNPDNSYRLTFDAPEGTIKVTADRVIMAIPFSVLRTHPHQRCRLPRRGLHGPQANGYHPARVRKERQASTAVRQSILGPARTMGHQHRDQLLGHRVPEHMGCHPRPGGSTGIMVDYTGGGVPLASFTGDADDPAVVAGFARTFLDQVEDGLPGHQPRIGTDAQLSTYPSTTLSCLGSYSYWKVGQYTLFSGYEGARQPDITTGKCHFAGEHCSINFQGFMEGGAEEGARAAGEILSDYKAGIFP